MHRKVVQYGSFCPEVHASSKEITRRKQRCSDVVRQFNSVGQSPQSLVVFFLCSQKSKNVEYRLPILEVLLDLYLRGIKFETLS